MRKVQADLDSLNSLRVSQNLPPYPNLQYTWGVTPFSKESRMTQSLTRRGYCFLDEYLEMYPDISLDAFPPQRPIHIPNECTLRLPFDRLTTRAVAGALS